MRGTGKLSDKISRKAICKCYFVTIVFGLERQCPQAEYNNQILCSNETWPLSFSRCSLHHIDSWVQPSLKYFDHFLHFPGLAPVLKHILEERNFMG